MPTSINQKADGWVWKGREKEYKSEWEHSLLKSKPWLKNFRACRARCYKSYKPVRGSHSMIDRGIRFLLTKVEVESMWFRDKAYQMKKPTIDRINTDGNYEIKNCRFIEMKDNSSRPKTRFGKTNPFPGVSWEKARNKWSVFTTVGNTKFLGRYIHLNDAIKKSKEYRANNS